MNHSLVLALGWTLLHSLWEGLLLAGLAWLALFLARRQSADLRYAVAASALALLVLACFTTFLLLLKPTPGTQGLEPFTVAVAFEPHSLHWLDRLSVGLRPALPWLCLGWSAGVALRFLRLGQSLVWLYGSLRRSAEPAPTPWPERFQVLCRRAGMARPVGLFRSDQVDTLLVLGWLKPMILIPAGAFLALPPEALEALIVHELAHIRRQDFLANLLQHVAETLLFYHPAVWWLSGRIRQEREHCCDDAAVQHCGDPILYASALAGLEELRIPVIQASNLAPAARGGRLMLRIQRLLQPAPTHEPFAPWLALVPMLLLAGTLSALRLEAAGTPRFDTATPPEAAKAEVAPRKVEFSKVKVKVQPPAPNYPADAKKDKIQGTVIVEVTVGADGKVTAAKALEGPPQLTDCAVDYARQWEFEPLKNKKGEAIPARFKLTMPFRLR